MKNLIVQIEDLVVIDLDEGDIHFPSSVEIASFPEHPATVFKEVAKNLMSRLGLWLFETYVCQFV